ncbi:MAG: formylglycine-generating enzyme family protein, partial [Trichodesmium sp. St18_bin1]|nr:formylglycine-generating enzyme family protein [Trichodesmium sp. St18_bin1]
MVTQTLGKDGLINDVFGSHWRDEKWHEVLRLISGMIDAKFVGDIISYLMEQDGEEEKFQNLFLAFECMSEVRSSQGIDDVESRLLNRLQELKNYCYYALVDDNFELAESLWIRILETGVYRDADAIQALQLIAIQNVKKHVSIEESEKGKLFTFEVVKVNSSGSIVNRRQESARQKIEDLGDGIELEMVYIPGGTFMMGSPENEEARSDDEGPQHNVTVSPFFMGKYPVTQGQWRAIASQTNLKVKLDLNPEPSICKESYQDIDRWQRPVEQVNWFQAVEFYKRLSKLTGRNYRLPSEAEWEYACRAGTTTPFYFGETITPELVNYNGDYTYGKSPKGEYRRETTPVGQFPPNAFGLYDMHGNIHEWCQDIYDKNYNEAPT